LKIPPFRSEWHQFLQPVQLLTVLNVSDNEA
jgi:hypothetical protein